MIIKVEITGVTPLLMAKFSEERLGAKKPDKNASEEEQAEVYAYRTEKGELMVPAICIFSSIMEGGKFSKRGKNKITTLKSSLVPAGISIVEEECLLGQKSYAVDRRSVVNPSTGGRIMSYRPRFDEWKLSFTLEVDEQEFSDREVKTLVQDAGSKCGLLSFRPSRKGWFGRFEITKWEVKRLS